MKRHNLELENITLSVNKFLNPLGFAAKVDMLHDSFLIEPNTRLVGKNRKDFFDGMMITYFNDSKIYEVAEYQAGKKQDQLWIYKETKNLQTALNTLIKGNKRKPIKVWS